MLPGQDQVVACPHCGALEKHQTLLSGNTFGAVMWSDGKQLAPMLPVPPGVARCHSCRNCYWLEEAAMIGLVSGWSEEDENSNPEWVNAPEVREPSTREYHAAIAAGLAKDVDGEKRLRILAWWRGNDAARGKRHDSGGVVGTAPPALRKANLERLAALLSGPSDDERIMRAEVLRELGRFADAEQLLNEVSSTEAAWVVDQLRALCEKKDPAVRELDVGATRRRGRKRAQ